MRISETKYLMGFTHSDTFTSRRKYILFHSSVELQNKQFNAHMFLKQWFSTILGSCHS